jgi:hypothetical protein
VSHARPVQGSFIAGMERPVGPIPPSVMRGTNADLIAAVAPLYLTGSVLDVTYGEGKWWERFTPEPFAAHDLYKLDGVDFTDLPDADGSFDAVCFDPPYVINAGDVTTRADYKDRYGIDTLKITKSKGGNDTLCALIRAGLAESVRVSRRWVLVKCMESAQGDGVLNPVGRDFFDLPWLVTQWALDLGCVKHDQIVHHTGSGPGGHNIFTIKRARRHHSYLLVFSR